MIRLNDPASGRARAARASPKVGSMNSLLDLLFTAGQAATALFFLYGAFLALAPSLMVGAVDDAASRMTAEA